MLYTVSAGQSHSQFVSKLVAELEHLGVLGGGGLEGSEIEPLLVSAFKASWDSVEAYDLPQSELCSYSAEKLRQDKLEGGELESLVADLVLALACLAIVAGALLAAKDMIRRRT